MIKNIIFFFTVTVCLLGEIEAYYGCRYITRKMVNVTESYTYSHLVTYYGGCDFGPHCLLSRWETRVKNKTIEIPDVLLEWRCCPGWREISTNGTRHYDKEEDLVCVPDPECIGSGHCRNTTSTMGTNPIFYNDINNGSHISQGIMRRRTTTTERPQFTNNDSVPYYWRYTTSTERNSNGTVPIYRRYTTTTERKYNDTIPYNMRRSYYDHSIPYRHEPYPWRDTTSTERNYNETVPSYQRYTTSTERNYNDTVPFHWRYTTTTERPYYGPVPGVPYDWRYTTSTERNNNGNVPSYRRYKTSIRTNYNDTMPYHWRYTTTTERPYNNWSRTFTFNDSTAVVSVNDSNETKIFDFNNTTSTRVRNLDKTVSASTNYSRSIPSDTEWHNNNTRVPYVGTDTNGTKDRTNITYSIGSLPDINEPYRPYNWNNTTYKRNRPTDHKIPFTYTTSAVDTNDADKEKETPMCPKQRWILILSTIILAFTALCVTLLVWRVILLKKHHIPVTLLVNQDPTSDNQEKYNATYTSTETTAKINNIYPTTKDLSDS